MLLNNKHAERGGVPIVEAAVDEVRLPRGVRPKHYSLHLTPDLENFTFEGFAKIKADVEEETDTIVLHANELEIDSAFINRGTKATWASDIQTDEEQERLILTFAEPLEPGEILLNIRYRGVLNDQMAGFYRSSYEVDGEERVMASTQFEATDARRAFPFWDEPALKATFDVSLDTPAHLTALSNMPERRVLNAGKTRTVYFFETTPVMSTYLLAFAVGEFEHLERTTRNGTLVRVFTTPGKRDEGAFALDVGVRCLEFYEDYFGIPYPLPKLDMLAIPNFAAGAMENWGLVTYRENALLIDEARSSTGMKQRVAGVVAHELAHQWFGNLVTMEWWTQLWLNEGFASWMSELALDHLFPEWNVWEQFFMNNTSALAADALRSTHPVETEIHHPDDINQHFDAISYSKGAGVINMIHAHLGPETFREGIHRYLAQHAYGNAVTEDLWAALEEVSGEPVRDIMDAWTKQPGYPLVTVEKYGGDSFLLRQSRFLVSGAEPTDDERAQRWHINLASEVRERAGAPPVFGSTRVNWPSSVDVFGVAADGLLKLNAGQNALVRVNYPPEYWKRLKAGVERGELSAIDRAGLLNDMNALVRAGLLPATKMLSFMEAYRNETSYIAWAQATGALGSISVLLPEDGQSREDLNAFARSILAPIAHERGWEAREGESHLDTLLRPMVLGAYGYYGDEATINEAVRRFGAFMANPADINPDMRGAIFMLAARNGNEHTYEHFLQCYRRANRQEDRVALLGAMGNFRGEGIVRQALEFSMSDDVRSQDIFYILGNMESRLGHELSWEFVQNNWDELRRRYAGAIMMVGRIVEYVISPFDTEEKAQEVEQFLAGHPLPEASQAIAQSLERVRSRAAWIQRDRRAAAEWLSDWVLANSVV